MLIILNIEEPVSEWIVELVDEGISPYSNNMYKQWIFTGPAGTKKIRITFSKFKTEQRYDFINVYNQYYSKVLALDGDLGAFVTDEIDASSIYVAFDSDYSITDEGFHIEKVEYLVD